VRREWERWLSMLFRLMLCSWVIFQGSVLGVGALEIERYEVVKRDVPAFGGQRWVLHFVDTQVEIPLVAIRNTQKGPQEDYPGLTDPDGFKMEWLVDDVVLWLSWRTPPRGNGVYYDEAHIIVDVSKGLANELRRVVYSANGNMGAGFHYHLDVTYSYNQHSRFITETLRSNETWLVERPYPLAVPEQEGVGPWLLQENLEQVNHFSIHPTRLIHRGSSVSLLLRDKQAPLEEVARYIVLRFAPRYGRHPYTPEDRGEVTATELEKVVSDLRGRVKVNETGDSASGSIGVGAVTPMPIRPRDASEEEYLFEN